MRHPLRHRLPLAATAVAATLLVTACTGGSAGSSGTSVGPSSPPASWSSSPSAASSPGSGVSSSAAPSGSGAAPQNPGAIPGVATNPAFVDQAIAQVDGIAQEMMAKSGVPGMAVAVVHGGRTVFAKGYGVREVGTAAPIDADTVFQLASVSKPIGATVVAAEVGKGTVGWDTPIATNLPDLTLSDPYVTGHVTIADMYSHRSGLPTHAGDDLEDLGYDQQQVFQRLKYLPLNPFRAIYNYTNFGLTAGAESVAAAAGTDWSTLSERDVYAPLGMTSTSSDFAAYLAAPNRAAGHALVDGAYQARYVRDPDGQSPAGGVSGSVNDVAKWMAMVLAGGQAPDGTQVVDAKALRAALTPVIRGADGSPTPPQIDARAGMYGYGTGVSNDSTGRVRLTHSGAFAAGAGTNVVMIPNLDLGIAVLVNASGDGTAEAVAATFADVAEFGSPQLDWLTGYHAAFAPVNAPTGDLVGQTPPAAPAPASPNSAYVGTYQNDYFGPITVSESGGTLVLTAGPKQVQYPLTHWDGQTFSLDPVGNRGSEPGGENVANGSISAVTFTVTGDTATSVSVEMWDHNGLGTFTR